MTLQSFATAHGTVETAFPPADSSLWLTVNHGGVMRMDDRDLSRFALSLTLAATICGELGADHPLTQSARHALNDTERKLAHAGLWTELDGNDLARLADAIGNALNGELKLPEKMRERIERLAETVKHYQGAPA